MNYRDKINELIKKDDERLAPDAATYLAMLGLGTTGAIAGNRIGEQTGRTLGRRSALETLRLGKSAIRHRMHTMANRMILPTVGDLPERYASLLATEKDLFDQINRADPARVRELLPQYSSTLSKTQLVASRIKACEDVRNNAVRLEAARLGKKLRQRYSRLGTVMGGKMGKILGGAAGGMAGMGVAYALTNPRMRKTLSRLIDREA